MVQSEPLPVHSRTPPSKKPSTYIFDSNGDTHLTLITYKGQTFHWEAERAWIGREISTNENHSDDGEAEKRDPSPEPAIPESPDTISPPIEGNNEVLYAESDTINHEEKLEPEWPDFGKIADSSDTQVEYPEYGERPGVQAGQVEIRMRVSGNHLALSSSYFAKMFAGPFTEANADHSGLRRVKATDWDPDAFNIILTIIHGYHRDVPKFLNLEMLAKVAIIVDYYECHEIVELHASIWMEHLEKQLPTVYGRDCILCLFVSRVFSESSIFRKMAQITLRHSGQLINAEDFPIADIFEQIDKTRQSSLTEIFGAIYDLLDLLQEQEPCSFECSSILLGVLTKELKSRGILSPRSANPFYGLSIEGALEMINGIRHPGWSHARDNRYDYGHHCTIQQKLSPAIERAKDGLRAFDLYDF